MVDNLIRLFDSAETSFDTNGIGVLPDAESCIVAEEKNGGFELEMVYPITGKRYSELTMRRIIVAKSNPYSNPQPFRIYSITKPFNGRVTVNAEHISYDMSGYPVPPFTAGSCADALSKLKENCAVACPFTFWTDKNVTKDFSTSRPYSMRSLLGGTDGSILSAFGKGEYEFDGYFVKLWLNRGKDRGVVIRYGKNLTDIEQEENCSSVYTGVYPYWYGENSGMVSLPEGIVKAEGTYNYTRILTLDLSDKWTEKPSEETLREAAENYIKNNKIGVPDVSLDISFEQLAQTKEYELYSMLEEVHLCDTVHVEFPDLGVSAKADCIKTEYDVLTDKYKKIELGSSKSTLASTIANQEKQLDETLSKTYLERTVEDATNLISGNSGGYVVFRNSDGGKQPNEILIMDTPNILTAKKVWRWNKSGLGYSKTGYNGSYGLAMTINGEINADFMTTGILNAISIRACDIKCGKIEEASSARTLRAAANEKYAFELSADGSITATKGTIGLCTIDEEGRLIVPAAHITDLLTADQIDATNLKVKAANVTGKLTANQINAKNLEITGSSSLHNYTYSISPDALLLKQGDTELLRADKNGITLAGEIKASKGTIGGFTIGNTAIYSGVTSMSDSEHSGVYLGTDGIRLGLKNAFSVTSSGSLTATVGQIGGWTISENGLYKTETVSNISTTIRLQTAYGSGTGTGNVSTINPVFEVRYDGTSKFYVRRNGFLHAEDADITGKIIASSGQIGTWTIGNDELFSGLAGISTNDDYKKPSLVTSGSNSKVIFYSGNANRTGGNFVVLSDGSLYAKAAEITGKITASSGRIGGLELGTEIRTIGGSTTVSGSVLKTPEADPNFSIFSYNYNGNIGSVLKVKTLELENQEFDNIKATSVETFSKIKAGLVEINSKNIIYDDNILINLNYNIGGTEVTATLSNNWASCDITINFNKNLPAEKTFYLRLHMTWGGWVDREMKVPSNVTTYTTTFSGPFWGWDDAQFTATGTKSYTYSTGAKNYIEFNKHVEPYFGDSYDLGSNTYAWKNEYFMTSPVIKSDRNVKKDISNNLEVYSKVFDLLKPSSYKFINGSSGRTHIGFIAQDVEEAIVSCGLTTIDFAGYCEGETEKGEITRSLRYEEFIALNTYEIQKLKKRVDELESILKVN